MPQENRSEVARIRAEITAEYEAAQHALSGLAMGTAQHKFITAHMERMGEHFETLAQIVGSKEEAAAILVETLVALPEGEKNAQL